MSHVKRVLADFFAHFEDVDRIDIRKGDDRPFQVTVIYHDESLGRPSTHPLFVALLEVLKECPFLEQSIADGSVCVLVRGSDG